MARKQVAPPFNLAEVQDWIAKNERRDFIWYAQGAMKYLRQCMAEIERLQSEVRDGARGIGADLSGSGQYRGVGASARVLTNDGADSPATERRAAPPTWCAREPGGASLVAQFSPEDDMQVLDQALGDTWALYHGDSAEVLTGLPADSVHLTVTSPPFSQLYTYSASDRDLGNCVDEAQFRAHFAFIVRALLRVTVPGRHACIHVAQIPSLQSKDGVIGLKDFRGSVIGLFVDEGWIYHGEICIDKDPQAQAIRTHAKALLFNQLRKDASWLRPALADYVLIFRKPGDNAIPVTPDLTNDEWIEWARPIWYGIREADTLQYTTARGAEDERHICPLQIGTIERCIRLWTNAGETVLDPFAGIGSTPYEAVRLGRKAVGIELKSEYFKVATRNLADAERTVKSGDLFSMAGIEV